MTIAPYDDRPVRLPDTDTWTLVVEAVAVLATRIADTELVPDHLRNKPAAVAAVILYGREVGLPPMTALRTVYVANGRVGMHAEAMRGLALARGHEITYREQTSAKCVIAGRRRGVEAWHEVTWTIDDARRANLLGSPSWTKYPRAMLKARATAELCRDLFGDVLGGFEAVEEIDDGEAAPEPRRRVARRTSGVATGPPTPEVPPEPEPKHSPETLANVRPVAEPVAKPRRAVRQVADVPLPDEAPTPTPSDVDAAESAARRALEAGLGPVHVVEAPSEPGTPPDPYTDEQRRAMHAAFGQIGINERQQRLDVTSAIVGRDVHSANELTSGEASTLLDTLRMALDTDEPMSLIDDLVRAAGLVVNDPMFDDGGNPL
jgi:hypothetical protein